MNFIFSDNVRILCLSCNVIKPKTTAKLSLTRTETSVVLIVFCLSSVKFALILFPFLTIVQLESGTRKAISWSVTVYN